LNSTYFEIVCPTYAYCLCFANVEQPGGRQLTPEKHFRLMLKPHVGQGKHSSSVDAREVLVPFYAHTQACIKQSRDMNGKMKLCRRDKQTYLDYHPDSGWSQWGPKLYSTRIVPAFYVDGSIYTAIDNFSWCQSPYPTEKMVSDVTDTTNECQGKELKTVEMVRNHGAGVTMVKACHVTTAIVREGEDEFTSRTNIGVGEGRNAVRRNVLEWYNGDELNNAARLFHDKFTRQPTQRMNDARTLHHHFMDELDRYLRARDICLRIEHSGKTYDGLQMSKSIGEDEGLEFEVLLIMVTIKHRQIMIHTDNM